MNVLVTGATGFLGSRTIEYLLSKSEISHILGTGRKFSHPNKHDHVKVSYSLGDLNSEDHVASLFTDDIHIVINCASLSSPWGKKEAFVKANVDTQRLLIKHAVKNKIKRFVYISSPSIYFEFDNKFDIKESDPLPKKIINHYAATKIEAEELLEGSELDYIILRPRALSGRGDTVIMPRLLRSYEQGRLKIVGDGQNLVDLTSVVNVAHAIWLSINADQKALNTAYNITNGKPIKLWHFINQTLEAIGYPRITKKVNKSVLHLVGRLMELKSKLGGYKREPILTMYSVGVLSQSTTLNIEKAKKLLGYIPIQNTEACIEEFVTWWKLKS